MRLRKGFKCILAMAVGLIVALGMAPAEVALADGTGTLGDVAVSATTTSGVFSEGDTVTVDIAITQNPGIKDLSLSIGFNTNALMFENYSLSGGPFSQKEVNCIENGDVIAFSVSSSQLPEYEGSIVSLKFEAYRSESVAPVTVSVNSYASLEDEADEDEGEEAVVEDDSQSEEKDSKTDKDKDKSGKTGKSGTKTNKVVRSRKVAGKADKSYKTGDGLGNNAFLVIGLVAAVAAGGLFVVDRKIKVRQEQ